MRRFASLALVLAVGLGGCSLFQKDDDRAPVQSEPPPQAEYLKETAVQPDAETRSGTAVENALAWSEKYAQAVKIVNPVRCDSAEPERANPIGWKGHHWNR